MSFLLPLGLIALIGAPLIYLIHLLYGTRRRVPVAALFLWQDLPRAPSGRNKRRLPPLSLLLLLQLLVAILAGLGLARPALSSEAPRHVAMILDASGSMQATDVSPNRFEAAKVRVGQRLTALGPADKVTLISAAGDAVILASGPPQAVRAALATARPGAGGAALREALALASTEVGATPERRGQIVLVTDAAWSGLGSVGALAAPVDVVTIGGGAENQAVSALDVRMDPSGRAQTAFIEIANQSDHAVRVPMRLSADDAPIDQRDVDLIAGGRTRVSVPLPVETHTLSVRLLGRDALALDDTATRIAPGGPPRDVLLVGRPTAALRRAFEALPFARLQVVDPSVAERPPADLTVLAGVLPTQLPPGPLLLVNPPSTSPRLLGVGLGSGARVEVGHPLLRGLDLALLRSETPVTSAVPGWGRVVLGSAQGPLIMAGRMEGHPTVALAFDPAASGLEKSLAFPLLVSNVASYLLTPGAVEAEPFDLAESDIRPKPVPPLATLGNVTAPSDGWTERWPWLLAGVLVLLTAEWLVFARRG